MQLKTAVSRRTCRSEENTARAWDSCGALHRNMLLMDYGKNVVDDHRQKLRVHVSRLDEVGILRRPAELMTSIRVALMGALSSGRTS